MADRPALPSEEEVEITPEMIEAGEAEVSAATGGYDLGGYFSARDLAIAVYQAMERRRLIARD